MADKDNMRNEFKDDYQLMQQIVAQLPESLRLSAGNYNNKEELKASLLEQRKRADQILKQLDENPDMRTVEYGVKDFFLANGAFYSTNNSVFISDGLVDKEKLDDTLLHEFHHSDFHNSKVAQLPMNMEQAYIVNMYNEMSAQMSTLLGQRQVYKMAETDEQRTQIIKRMKDHGYSFYAEAIEQQQFNPLSNRPEDFKKEMEFMFHGTQKMWMDTYANKYRQQNTGSAISHFYVHKYDELKKNDENFNKARTEAFRLGGFDFAQFQDDESVKCLNKAIVQADCAIQNNASRKMVNDYMMDSYNKFDISYQPIKSAIPSVRDDMSLSQQYQLGLYQGIMEEAKSRYDAYTLYNKNLSFNDVLENVVLSYDVKEFGKELCGELLAIENNPKGDNHQLKKNLAEACTIDGVNYLPVIKKLQKTSNNVSLSEVQDLYGKAIKQYEKKSLEERQQYWKQQFFTAENWANNQASSAERDYVVESSDYFGAPKYAEGAKTITTDILDLTQPILQNELIAKEIRSATDDAIMQIDAAMAADNIRANKQQKIEKNSSSTTKNKGLKSQSKTTKITNRSEGQGM